METMKEEILESWMIDMPDQYINFLDSRAHLSHYFVSVHEYYRGLEKLCPVYHFQSPELEYRGELVRWLKALQNELTFSDLALHLGIYLMDFFMDNHMISIEKLSRVALVSILIAVSFEDQDGILPRLQSLCEKISHPYDRDHIIEVQGMVLQFYNFSIGRPTVAHFAYMYLAFVIDIKDLDVLAVNKSGAVTIELYESAQSLLRDMLSKCLNEVQYLKFEQSLLASVLVLAVRKALGLLPCWTKLLQFMTGYTAEDLHPCISLYNTFQDPESQISTCDFEFPATDDSGYTTSSSCHSPGTKQPSSEK